MGIIELFLIALGLSMDAFAVSVCKGLNMKKMNYRLAGIIALFFGSFQAAMPFIGYMLGKQFEHYIIDFDHWIAFLLLSFIGGKMIYEALKKHDDCQCNTYEGVSLKELLLLSIATSIDALAVGITFAFLQVNIAISVTCIGIITFLLSLAGVIIGNKFGSKYESKAELAGGIILVLIGLKILLEHLGILVF